MFANIIVHQIW